MLRDECRIVGPHPAALHHKREIRIAAQTPGHDLRDKILELFLEPPPGFLVVGWPSATEHETGGFIQLNLAEQPYFDCFRCVFVGLRRDGRFDRCPEKLRNIAFG
jgi:hypothetical protein